MNNLINCNHAAARLGLPSDFDLRFPINDFKLQLDIGNDEVVLRVEPDTYQFFSWHQLRTDLLSLYVFVGRTPTEAPRYTAAVVMLLRYEAPVSRDIAITGIIRDN